MRNLNTEELKLVYGGGSKGCKPCGSGSKHGSGGSGSKHGSGGSGSKHGSGSASKQSKHGSGSGSKCA